MLGLGVNCMEEVISIDWSLVLSLVTAIAALVALFFSGFQVRQANKQCLFDRRVKAWLISQGLFELYEKEEKALAVRSDGPEFANRLQFTWLTNNAFLFEIGGVVSHPLQEDEQKLFLRKIEELQNLSIEVSLIFKNDSARSLCKFLDAYKELLLVMYRYQIVLDKMENSSCQFSWTLEKAVQEMSEPGCRSELYDARDKLRDAFKAYAEKNTAKQLEKQMRLSY